MATNTVECSGPPGSKVITTPGEYWMQCPYDVNHKALNHRYAIHLEKCRRNYLDRKRASGELPVKLSCKYNPAHQIMAPELLEHESKCDDRKLAIVDYLYTAIYDDVMKMMAEEDGKEPPIGMKEEDTIKIKETKKVWNSLDFAKGLNFDDIVMLVHQKFNQPPINENEVSWANPQLLRMSGPSPGDFSLPQNQLEEPIHFKRQNIRRRRRRDPSPHPSKLGDLEKITEEDESEKKDDPDDEEYWLGGNEPPFSWYDNQLAIRPKNFKFPLDLSKSQRKEFTKIATNIFKYEHGRFVEDTGEEERIRLPSVIRINSDEPLYVQIPRAKEDTGIWKEKPIEEKAMEQKPMEQNPMEEKAMKEKPAEEKIMQEPKTPKKYIKEKPLWGKSSVKNSQ